MTSANFILNSLPAEDYEWLWPQLQEVELQQGNILYRIREQITDAYFPLTCLLSWTNLTEMGEIVEVGITGYEGMAGVPLLLNEDISPWQIGVQISGKAYKLSKDNFVAALERSATLKQRVTAFTYLKMVQLCQSALCNRFHSAEERLCRWLLAAQDRTRAPEFALTREILAEMIGAGRPTVSIVVGILQSAGLMRANRGNITILDRQGMEDSACECYLIGKQALDHYLTKQIEV